MAVEVGIRVLCLMLSLFSWFEVVRLWREGTIYAKGMKLFMTFVFVLVGLIFLFFALIGFHAH
jgi:hypothetical protein